MTIDKFDRTDLGQGFVVERLIGEDGAVSLAVRHMGVPVQRMQRDFMMRVLFDVILRLLNQRDEARQKLRRALRAQHTDQADVVPLKVAA